jgi:hypothetical protein
MNLAAILAFYLVSLGWLHSPQGAGGGSTPTQASPAAPAKTQNAPAQAKPSAKRRRKKTPASDCSNSPAPLNPAPLNSAASIPENSTNSPTTASDNTTSTTPSSNNVTPPDASPAGEVKTGSLTAVTTIGAAASPKPCPLPKKVVRNGGAAEPTIELKGGNGSPLASSEQSSTSDLSAATQENLKQMEGRQLNSSQQEMIAQVKQYVEQSKSAIAAGDLDLAHDFALKARLLSDDLVKP